MEAGEPVPLCFEKPTFPLRPQMTTSLPTVRKASASASPMPVAPPVMSAVFPARFLMVPSASRSRPSARTAGAKVYISARKAAACEETAKRLSVFGECIAMPADASGAAGARTLAGLYLAKELKLDILVNNAGAHGALRSRPFPRTVGTK